MDANNITQLDEHADPRSFSEWLRVLPLRKLVMDDLKTGHLLGFWLGEQKAIFNYGFLPIHV